MATDLVCGMNVEEQLAADKLTHEGTVYYFCSAACPACEQRSCRRYKAALSALAMTGLVVLILLWRGFSPLTAAVIAIVVSGPVAALYAWWLSRRVLRPLEDTKLTRRKLWTINIQIRRGGGAHAPL